MLVGRRTRQQVVGGGDKLFRIDRRGQERVGAGGRGYFPGVVAGEGGRDHEDRDMVAGLVFPWAQQAAEAPAVDTGHVEVGDDEWRQGVGTQLHERFVGAGQAGTRDSFAMQDAGEDFELQPVVVDHHDRGNGRGGFRLPLFRPGCAVPPVGALRGAW